jgi:ribosomal protein S18 acetylase RimI-like enzyme
VQLRTGDGGLAEIWAPQIHALYCEVFSVPPFRWDDDEPARHRSRLASVASNPTATVAIALSEESLVGFAYGVPWSPSQDWWSTMTPPPPDSVRREWPGRTFLLIDLALEARYRGRGAGRALVSSLLATRTEERGVLTVQATALATQAFYRGTGWRHQGRLPTEPTAGGRTWDVYLRDLS